MNFKPTSLKAIISIVVGLLLGLWASKVYYIGGSGPPYIFSMGSILGFIVGLVVIYIIWSLIQKKN
jgi:xanthosine utilization system XapX-like protein